MQKNLRFKNYFGTYFNFYNFFKNNNNLYI
uniref:Uncharacterized protein n=1 Tax=viral metagenome TaxID=1070528 RepID=A0A6C0H8I3_9ZZZZ